MANCFELVKDGVTYSCEEKVNSNPNAVVPCINAAKGYPAYFDQAQSINLCTGAKSNAPVDCVNSAIGYPRYLRKDQALQICKAGKVFSVGGVEFVQKFDFLKSLNTFKKQLKSSK